MQMGVSPPHFFPIYPMSVRNLRLEGKKKARLSNYCRRILSRSDVNSAHFASRWRGRLARGNLHFHTPILAMAHTFPTTNPSEFVGVSGPTNFLSFHLTRGSPARIEFLS